MSGQIENASHNTICFFGWNFYIFPCEKILNAHCKGRQAIHLGKT